MKNEDRWFFALVVAVLLVFVALVVVVEKSHNECIGELQAVAVTQFGSLAAQELCHR
jgi:hypothetical protein